MCEGEGPTVVDGMAFRDRAVYLTDADALVLADLHLGRDVTSAVEAPLGERSEIFMRLSSLLDLFDPAEVVIAGDVLHAFDTLPMAVEETFEDVTSLITETAGATLTLVAGNHDTMLHGIAEPVLEYRLADRKTLVCHGDEGPEGDAERYIVGHEHPAIDIEGVRRPCYLLGQEADRGSDLVCLPAFNQLTIGTAINRLQIDDFDSPLLGTIDEFRPVVRDEQEDQTFIFPPFSQLQAHL